MMTPNKPTGARIMPPADDHIRLTPEISAMLANVANRHNRTPDELIEMAIRTMNAALPACHRFKTKTRPKQDHDALHDHH